MYCDAHFINKTINMNAQWCAYGNKNCFTVRYQRSRDITSTVHMWSKAEYLTLVSNSRVLVATTWRISTGKNSRVYLGQTIGEWNSDWLKQWLVQTKTTRRWRQYQRGGEGENNKIFWLELYRRLLNMKIGTYANFKAFNYAKWALSGIKPGEQNQNVIHHL